MQISEFIAETIVNKLHPLLNKDIVFSDSSGNVLASSDLSKTGKHYSQMLKAVQGNKIMEVGKEDIGFIKDPLSPGVIVPVLYGDETVGAIYIQDEQANYNKIVSLIKTTAELMLNQILVVDSIPYKGRIRDNFIYGLVHRKISWDDPRTYDEAELLDIGLHKDKAVILIYALGFWQSQFHETMSTGEDEKQSKLHQFKKKIFDAVKSFFGETGAIEISYFGNDNFVVLIDENQHIKGNQIVEHLRSSDKEFNAAISSVFRGAEKVYIAAGNFYRGKDGLALAYEEAKVALHLGVSVSEDRAVYHVDDLGMIAILAGGNKRWQETFVHNLLTQMISEKYLMETVEAFFNQNMSLTQTAKNLGIHRNTLLYRLSKIQKITGLDPRKFNDAIKIKLAFVLSYLREKEKV